MVVMYRLGALSTWMMRRLNLVKSKYFAQPNLLADRRIVGEYFQEQIDPQALGAELLTWLDDAERRAKLEHEFMGHSRRSQTMERARARRRRFSGLLRPDRSERWPPRDERARRRDR